MSEIAPQTFASLLGASEAHRSTDDVLAAALPLLRQVADAHDRGQVAPLVGAGELHALRGRLWFENAKCAAPRRALDRVNELQTEETLAVAVVARTRTSIDSDGSRDVREDLAIAERGEPLTRPAHLPGFVSWEHEIEHHDAVTDVYVLGLVLASLAVDIDLGDRDGLARFVAARRDVTAINARIHPVVARAIERMTDLDRRRRPQDLHILVASLERYRDQEIRPELDPEDIRGLVEKSHESRRAVIASRLRSRLFDLSRRNRLLYFRPSGQSLDLTEVSVPLVLDVRNIGADALFTGQPKLLAELARMEPVVLGRYVRFEDYPFVTASLDKLRTTSARSQADHGFSSLKLAVCTLHWHDLKKARDERIHSPLLLLPVELVKKKGVRDAYLLTATSELAEVNPVLRHVLAQSFGIHLPDAVDLSEEGSVDALFATLTEQIRASEPAVLLERIDKPAIELIHARVRRRLDVFRKRAQLSGRGVRARDGVEYSYRRDNFQPLGLRLFALRVKLSEAPDATIFDKPRPRTNAMAPAPQAREVDKELYARRSGGNEGGPLKWGFDSTCVTLANFDYQKMSLVRDYETLVDEERPNRAFDALFSTEPRPVFADSPNVPLAEQFPVVAADATQTATVARARSGASFIIQGPPGTGKSQTITNLIADYVARGKRVLFVCEKRAAIDVVYHRLAQLGLDRLTCLIHDSQSDKKAFIAGLKASYEGWIEGAGAGATAEKSAGERSVTLATLAAPLDELARFDRLMSQPAHGSDAPLVHLIRRGIELAGARTALSPAVVERLPSHAEMAAARAEVAHLARVFASLGEPPILARHPARLLGDRVLASEHPIGLVSSALAGALPVIERVLRSPASAARDGQAIALAAAFERASLAARLAPLANAGLLALLDEGHELYRRFRGALAGLTQRGARVAEAAAAAAGWKTPIGRSDLPAVTALARTWHEKLWRFLFPSFWRLRSIVRARFDFSAALVPPTYVDALARLEARYTAEDELAQATRAASAELGVEDLEATRRLVESLASAEGATPAERDLKSEILRPPAGAPAAEWALGVAAAAEDLAELRRGLDVAFDGHVGLTLADLATELRALDRHATAQSLPELVRALAEVGKASRGVLAALRALPLRPEELEWAIGERAIASTLAREPTTASLDGRAIALRNEQLDAAHGAWRRANAAHILERARGAFRENVRRASAPAAGRDEREKAFKKDYTAGRRDLEHEMGKVMRFKSIRELMTGKTGLVVRDVLPVWLMSPLSVADTLPMTSDYFDVVIFDEASQIPLEDAIPAIFRADQCIVVGDEKQLPPTNFFGTTEGADDDDGAELDADVSYELDADSLLAHAARTLPSTMLGWHYRSRDEALIQFSNQAFYAGKLATVPTPRRATPRTPIAPREAAEGKAGAHHTLERSVSFHRLHGAVYEARTNLAEAEYIAEMVRELLAQDAASSARPTLGIVAFSEAQQGEIESALDRLAATDEAFRARLESEYEREEDGQFAGLFVKNLENVQGDERDVIVLSICYGPDAHGRMRMNFGPINKRGGEKRLNVIFSRARKHLAVVSSIDDAHITNDYNDGANTLRCYLRYAAALSRGDEAEARAALRAVSGGGETRGGGDGGGDPTAKALAAALRARGLHVDEGVGGSRFRCELAVRAAGERDHRVAVLVDTDAHYASGDTDERYRVRPALLRAFGWCVETVLAKDWREAPEETVERIVRAL